MKQIYTFFFSILFLTAFASAQTAQDTTYYTDEQGRTVVIIKQNQGATPSAQQNGAIQTSPEAALAAGPDDANYQKTLESYKTSAQKLRTAGNVLLWGGVGLAVVGIALELSDSPDVCDDYDDDCDDSYSSTYITGIMLTLIGVDMIPPGIILKIAARSVDRRGARYQSQHEMNKSVAPANNGYSLLLLPKLDIEGRAAGASLALGF